MPNCFIICNTTTRPSHHFPTWFNFNYRSKRPSWIYIYIYSGYIEYIYSKYIYLCWNSISSYSKGYCYFVIRVRGTFAGSTFKGGLKCNLQVETHNFLTCSAAAEIWAKNTYLEKICMRKMRNFEKCTQIYFSWSVKVYEMH